MSDENYETEEDWSDDNWDEEEYEEVSEVSEVGSKTAEMEEKYSDENVAKEISADLRSDVNTSAQGMVSTGESEHAESSIARVLDLKEDSFTQRFEVVGLSELAFSETLKSGRRRTYGGLSQSVKEMGILTPIHVLELEGYLDWKKSTDPNKEREYAGLKYLLIDGFRRIYAGARNKISDYPAIVWTFTNPEQGSDIATALSLLLNKFQNHAWDEIWGLLQVLEENYQLNPSVLEYLLRLDPGDSMKLRDLMLSDQIFDEIKSDLVQDKLGLFQASKGSQGP